MAATSGETKWYQRDATPGYVLLAATIMSFVLLNGPTHDLFYGFLSAPLAGTVAGYEFDYTVKRFIKDALMAVFFLYVGLELKREVVEGPFRNPREAALPALGALGGMAAPALVFILVTQVLHPDRSPELLKGWAIPTATDIAFAVGVLSLLGSRLPSGLRLFLLALAIADDLGAILVIALFYTTELDVQALAVSTVIFAGLMILNWRKVTVLWPYWVGGLALWLAVAKTGASPTLAGVLTALAVPMRRLDGGSPLIDAEHALKYPVQLGIMPLFALAIAGVPLAGQNLGIFLEPLTLGIALGLMIGKPLGIVSLTMIGSKVLRQPPPCGFNGLIGVSLVAGIGFTMSLFVGSLAFDEYLYPHLAADVRFGVLGGSFLSAALGLFVLSQVYKTAAPPKSTDLAREEELAERRGVLEDIDPPPEDKAKDR